MNRTILTALTSGITIHDRCSGAVYTPDAPSGWHHATVWAASDGERWRVFLRPENGSQEAIEVGRISRSGRFYTADQHGLSRQRIERAALASEGLDYFVNGQTPTRDLEILGWIRCSECSRWLSAGESIQNGMGPWCAGRQARTDRAAKKRAGLDRMQALIDARRRGE